MKKYLHNLIAWKLKILVKWLLVKNHPQIIGITGSVGKSTTKEAIHRVLSLRFESRIRKSEGNLNTEIGLPLAILGFKTAPRFYEWPYILILSIFRVLIPKLNPLSQISILVLEYSADKPGDIEYLTNIIKPDIAIITITGPAHLENYQSIDQIANEKMHLALSVGKSGIVILNKRDPYTKQFTNKIKGEIKYFDAPPREISKIIAKKIGEIFEINQKLVDRVLNDIKPLEHRLNLIRVDDFFILDDCYNANPMSMKLALEELSLMAKELKASRKIAVLGDMLELGRDSEKYHQEVGQLAKRFVDLVIGIGPLSKLYDPDKIFNNINDSEDYILENIKKGDIILFKASRKIGLEKLVEKIIKK